MSVGDRRMKHHPYYKIFMALLWTFCLSGGFVSSCNSPTLPMPTQVLQATGFIVPYLTPTATQTLPSPTLPQLITETPLPTSTPLTYTVAEGDTMLGIALRYGISLEKLKTANPDVDPRAMSIGLRLVIPAEGTVDTLVPSPTPMPLSVSAPECYPQQGGGLGCVLTVKNDQETAFESLSVWVRLYSSDGTLQAEKVAVAPLNLLRPGETMPLIVEFPEPVLSPWVAQSGLAEVLPAETSQDRYLEVEVENLQVELHPTGKSARLRGKIQWPVSQAAPRIIWLAAVALDSADHVVGLRKVELASPCGMSSSEDFTPVPEAAAQANCRSASFDVIVYSLGPAIQRAVVLVEARP